MTKLTTENVSLLIAIATFIVTLAGYLRTHHRRPPDKDKLVKEPGNPDTRHGPQDQ